ncbi:hypothetical protein, partial [Xaviernesmea oryzae]|uniref:hypothetical protein n=1 Tax=Xaviernesmea oryzae TaxID=464029 RepID=UPI001480D706
SIVKKQRAKQPSNPHKTNPKRHQINPTSHKGQQGRNAAIRQILSENIQPKNRPNTKTKKTSARSAATPRSMSALYGPTPKNVNPQNEGNMTDKRNPLKWQQEKWRPQARTQPSLPANTPKRTPNRRTNGSSKEEKWRECGE